MFYAPLFSAERLGITGSCTDDTQTNITLTRSHRLTRLFAVVPLIIVTSMRERLLDALMKLNVLCSAD